MHVKFSRVLRGRTGQKIRDNKMAEQNDPNFELFASFSRFDF